MLRRSTSGIRLWLYRESSKLALLLVFRELRYDACVILRGTPRVGNALTERLSIRFT